MPKSKAAEKIAEETAAEPEETEEEEEEEDEEEEEEGETEGEEIGDDEPITVEGLLKTWEATGVIVELHGFADHDEILIIEDGDEEPQEGQCGLLGLEELVELQDILAEAKTIMSRRQALRTS